MSIEVGNLVSRNVWRYPVDGKDIFVVNSVSPSAIKFYDIETPFNEMYNQAKEDFRKNGYLTEDDDGNEICIKYDEEDENEPYLETIVSRIMGCPGYDDYKEFRGTDKWDFIDVNWTEHFSLPIWKHLEFKMVHTQLIKMTNLKTLEKLSVQYFKNEDGKAIFIREGAGYNGQWTGEYIDNESAVFLANDSCWEVATTVYPMNEDDDEIEFEIL